MEINKQPDPIKMFSTVNKIKKLLKPIKVERNRRFIDKIMNKSFEISGVLTDGYSLRDDEYVDLSCEIKSTIGLTFWACFGRYGANHYVRVSDEEVVHDFDDPTGKKKIVEHIEKLWLPKYMEFNELTLKQEIGNYKSEFHLKID